MSKSTAMDAQTGIDGLNLMDELTVVYNAPDLTDQSINGSVIDELLNITNQGVPVIVNLGSLGRANASMYVAKLRQLGESLGAEGLDRICLSSGKEEVRKALEIMKISKQTIEEIPLGLFNTYKSPEEAIASLDRSLTHRIELTPDISNEGNSTARVILTHETTAEDIDRLLQVIWFYEPLDKYNIVVTIPKGANYNQQIVDMLKTAKKELQANGMEYQAKSVDGVIEFSFKPTDGAVQDQGIFKRSEGLIIYKIGPLHFSSKGLVTRSADYLQKFLWYGGNLTFDCSAMDLTRLRYAQTYLNDMAKLVSNPGIGMEFGVIDQPEKRDENSEWDKHSDVRIYTGKEGVIEEFYKGDSPPYAVTIDEEKRHIGVNLGDTLTIGMIDELTDMLVKFDDNSQKVYGYVIQVKGLENMQKNRRPVLKRRLARALGAKTNMRLTQTRNCISCTRANKLIFTAQYAA